MTSVLPLEIDLAGRVKNMRLAPSNAMYALFEAVVNSIHAVLDGPEPACGSIRVKVLRAEDQLTTAAKKELGPVVGFEITDNGVGFDDKNFASFRRSDSTTKAKFGGKGVGRLLWLKVFSSVKITSVYQGTDGSHERKFTFSTEGISPPTIVRADEKSRETIIEMKAPQGHYRQALQHDPQTIAIAIVEHCVEFFISPQRPKVFLIDENAGYEAELGDLFHDELKSEIKRSEIDVGGAKFQLTHLLFRGRKNSRHSINLCAHHRKVKEESLADKIPGLSGGLRPAGSSEDLEYQGYLSGTLLDQLVDTGRTNFDFDGLFLYDSENPPSGTVSYPALLAEAVSKAREFLKPTLDPILEANALRIREQIEDNYPQYRHLLHHRPEAVAAIPPNLEGVKLDLALYQIEQQLDGESREALSKELSSPCDPDESPDERRVRLEELMEKVNDSGMAKLARHVVYRRAVIAFLEDQMGLQSGGKYALEDAVHTAVCPTKTTSDEIPASRMNLWLLDDRFSFHCYLSSDMSIRQMKEVVQVESEDRPDLAIFQRTMAFSDSLDDIGAVVLVEFKRPARDDYDRDDPDRNPVSQVLKYVDTLRSGKARGPKGRVIDVRENTPFYAYIVADMTPKLRLLADREDFTDTPDRQGYFRFFAKANCYIEIVSFRKMIRDAKKRNQAFFDRLNIPL